MKQSTVSWKNSSAGLFVSTDGGKTWGYGWEEDDTAVRTAILLEQTLKELDDRYKKATELSEELLKELDERYKTATAISAELQKTLDQRYETAKSCPRIYMRNWISGMALLWKSQKICKGVGREIQCGEEAVGRGRKRTG